MKARWLLLAGLVVLSACGGSPETGPVRSLPGEAGAPPPTAVNGTYRGIARLIKATIAGCPRSFGQRMVVVDANALSLNYRGPKANYGLVATVAGDGSIYGTDGTGTIQGRISGRHMDLIVNSDYCELRYALDKVGR
jgi:hypothetical protein